VKTVKYFNWLRTKNYGVVVMMTLATWQTRRPNFWVDSFEQRIIDRAIYNF